MKKRWLQKTFLMALLGSFLMVSIPGCGNSAKMQQEIDTLKQEVESTQSENEKLRKQVEILSKTVKDLTELNAMLQEKSPEETKKEATKK